MAKRGCGERTKGGIYLECPVGDVGMPVEHFLVDTPFVIDPDEYGLSPVGVKLVEKNGITHVFDIVGQEYYPNVADFVEEIRRMGLSRKVSPTLDFKRLTAQSKIILLHARAFDHNFSKFPSPPPCPKLKCGCSACQETAKSHSVAKGKRLSCMCAGLWWNDIEGGDPKAGGGVIRQMPAFSFQGAERPKNIKPKYELAMFMRLPINNIAVIKDPDHGRHEQAEAKAAEAGVPVMLKDE